MRVFELIEQLKQFPPMTEVVTITDNFEQGRSLVLASSATLYPKGSKTKENFRDAFDGTPYSGGVYRY